MFAKLFLVFFLATLVVSLPKNENELVNTALNSGTHLMKEFSKLIADDADKYSVDLNSVYKKYEIESKTDETKRRLLDLLKKVIDYGNEYIKRIDKEHENQMIMSINEIKKEDPVLGEKLMKFYEKLCEKNRIGEDILKYYLDGDKLSNNLEKAWSNFGHKTAQEIKRFETFVIEHLPKKGKGKK